MKRICHIYFDFSGNALVGELTDNSNGVFTLSNVEYTDNTGNKHTLKKCHVYASKIAFYYIENVVE